MHHEKIQRQALIGLCQRKFHKNSIVHDQYGAQRSAAAEVDTVCLCQVALQVSASV